MPTCPTCRKRYPDGAETCEVDGEALLHDQAFVGVEKELEKGQKIGEYVVESKIGEGGFGSVYAAVHPLIGKQAAIKVLHRQYSSNPQMVSRFIAEARSVNQIKNRHIIDIFSFGALEDGRQYYVMELLEGMPLDAYLRQRGRLSPEEAVPILRGIAKALDAAHANGVAHRDLKPENVFLVLEDDGPPFPKLLDFGIAKLLGESAAQHKTRTGTPMGTPAYMSPEQCRGKNVDHRTDLYSLGVLAHETLTGKVPFDGGDVMEILFKQTSAEPPPMSTTCPAVPAALDAAVLQMLAKDPAKRPVSALDAIEEIASAARGAGFAVPSPQRIPGRRASGDGAKEKASGGLTPAEIGALAAAQTIAQASTGSTGKTLMASEAEVKPAPPSRTIVYGVVVAACLMGVGVGLFVTRGHSAGAEPSSSGPIAGGSVPAAEPLRAAVSVAPSVAPAPAPAPSSEPLAAEPAEIEIAVTSNAPHLEVFDGPTLVGSAPGKLRLQRSDSPRKLTFKAPGFKPLEREVSVARSDALELELVKVQGSGTGPDHDGAASGPKPRPVAGPKKGHGDLEF